MSHKIDCSWSDGICTCGSDIERLRKDAGILLANLDFMQEATGESLDPEDAAVVALIRADLGSVFDAGGDDAPDT